MLLYQQDLKNKNKIIIIKLSSNKVLLYGNIKSLLKIKNLMFIQVIILLAGLWTFQCHAYNRRQILYGVRVYIIMIVAKWQNKS